ncbi:MAG: glycosyltransferase [Candidatus Sulfotelmatobacter sp.]
MAHRPLVSIVNPAQRLDLSVSNALIITVNFRHADCTLDFLKSASMLPRFSDCNLLVVDNCSGDDSVSRLRQVISEFTNVELLASQQNRGYFGGAKWALQQYLAQHRMPDWVIVCNNDIVFDDPRFLATLLERNPAIFGVIAPSVISRLTGHDANPMIRRRPTLFLMWRYRLLLSNYPVAWLTQWLAPSVRKVRNSLYAYKENGESKTPIYAPHGSFMIFSRRFFDAGGFIDDGFFLYAEEFCVAEMCRQLNLPIIHDPHLRVWHEEGRTLGRMLSRDTYAHQKNGLRYALARYKDSYRELAATTGPTRTVTPTEEASECHRISAAGDGLR